MDEERRLEEAAKPVAAAIRRHAEALARIDAANAEDPTSAQAAGLSGPKALVESRRASEWLGRLAPEASEALRLAVRAHHIRRWRIPRASRPKGRAAYLAWRAELHELHAREVGRILEEVGYDAAFVARVQDLVRKKNLARDAEAQALEDALCLVFLETELADVSRKLDEAKLVSVLQKTWRKMSPAARELALALPLAPEARALVAKAVGGA